jgi:hypothetical protein
LRDRCSPTIIKSSIGDDVMAARGKALTINTVVREQKAIIALAESLKAAGGFLNGEDASKIIREKAFASGK